MALTMTTDCGLSAWSHGIQLVDNICTMPPYMPPPSQVWSWYFQRIGYDSIPAPGKLVIRVDAGSIVATRGRLVSGFVVSGGDSPAVLYHWLSNSVSLLLNCVNVGQRQMWKLNTKKPW